MSFDAPGTRPATGVPPSLPALRRPPGAGRPALVVASPWPYHPACGIGGGALCFALLERLAGHYDIHFAAFDECPNDPEGGRRALGAVAASVSLVPLPPQPGGLADRWQQGMQVIRRAPRETRGMASPAMHAVIAGLAAAHRPQAVLLQFPHMAQYAGAAPGVPVVMDTQDVALASRWREWRAGRDPARHAALGVAWAAWARYELHWYARCDALLALSGNDLGVLRTFLPEVPSILSPVAAELRPAPPPQTAPRVAFIGNFAHAPNRDALDWLQRAIWPRVRARRPEAELLVAGVGAPPDPGDAAAGITLRGFVPDLDAFFAEAQLSVVPYRFGGGTKIKLLDAMARGCPVVATGIGAEGLDCVPGEQLLVAEDAEGLAAAILQLLDSEEARRRLAAAARTHLARHLSWEEKVAGLVGLLQEVGARRAARLAA